MPNVLRSRIESKYCSDCLIVCHWHGEVEFVRFVPLLQFEDQPMNGASGKPDPKRIFVGGELWRTI